MREYQVCTNCVMDTTDSKITFDDKGVCDHCNTYYDKILPNWHPNEKGQAELDKIVEGIKKEGKGKDFDCIIGMSGGIDSSYLLYLAKEKLGLRPLVFHVDAGWNSQIAVNNIERIVDKLKLDLYTHVINWEEMKDLQLAFFKSGVPHIDTPQDHAFFATMYDFASKHNIKHILTGGNYSTECVRNPMEWMYFQSDSIQLKDIHKKFGKKKFDYRQVMEQEPTPIIELLVSDYKNFILCIFNAVLIFIVIFLFKKQALQLKLTRLFMLIVIVEAFFIFLSYQNISAQGNVNIGWEIIYLPISLVFSLAAYRKVKKDWELLKSVDRIR